MPEIIEESDNNYSDWEEENIFDFKCLFCKDSLDENSFLDHLAAAHSFDLRKFVTANGTDFHVH